ncbi:MAG: hypothetical protein M3N45_10315, partial [Actinomycetota bacterium]|nr:hypothetical protein [Actinomycetota bacterium]
MTLIAIPSEVQQGISTGEATNPAVSCANEERQVASFTGSGSQTTDSISITAQLRRYLYQAA